MGSTYRSVLAFLVFFSPGAFAADFPTQPDRGLTPGELCSKPSERRYPERIAYCRRAVSVETKEAVVALYDRRLGYDVGVIGRRNFKIDHYIPLCMGGSNSMENLWPQHLSISEKTDFVEQVACDKMREGTLKQAEAIQMIKTVKNDTSRVPEILAQLQRY